MKNFLCYKLKPEPVNNSKPYFIIHIFMKYAHHKNIAVGAAFVKNDMATLRKFSIALANMIAFNSNVGVCT